MNGIVLYKTKCGSTKEYAEMIGGATHLPVKSISEANKKLIRQKDTLVIGSYIRMGQIGAKGWIERNWDILRSKKVILFSVSGSSPKEIKEAQVFENNFSKEQQDSIKYFPLRGRKVTAQLHWFLRAMLKLAGKMTKDPDERAQMTKDFDYVKKENITEIVKAIV